MNEHKAKPKNDGHDQQRIAAAVAKRNRKADERRKRATDKANKLKRGWRV